MNGYENIDRNIFFSVKKERRTRGHGITLAKKQCRLDIRKFSFSQRTVIVDQPICDIKLSSAFFVNSMKLW